MTRGKGTPELDAAETEATGGTGGKTITIGEMTLSVPRKFKRLKVLRLLSKEDLFGAILAVFGEETAERLEELELDDAETAKFLEDFAIAATGVDPGNLPSSRT